MDLKKRLTKFRFLINDEMNLKIEVVSLTKYTSHKLLFNKMNIQTGETKRNLDLTTLFWRINLNFITLTQTSLTFS